MYPISFPFSIKYNINKIKGKMNEQSYTEIVLPFKMLQMKYTAFIC